MIQFRFNHHKTHRTGVRLALWACLLQAFAWAQPPKFQKVYGGYSYDQGNDLIQMPDTGYLLLCTSGSFSASSDLYLLKVDKAGNYEWQHTYGGPEIEGACKIKLTQDGNIAMAGHTASFPGRSYDFYLVKAALNGDTIWTKHYGSNEWDFANSMDTCADGGFVLAGKTYDTGNAFSDILIVKTDANGNEQWQKKIGGIKDEVANAIISVPDGYVICGTTESIGSGGKDIYVAMLDITGNVLWERTFGEQNNDEGTSCYLSSENIIVVGGKITLGSYPLNYNTFLIKLRKDGSNYWQFSNSSIGLVNYQINSVIEGYNKGITSAGSFNPNSPEFNDLFVFINDSMGSYNNSGTLGGSLEDYGKSVIKTSDYGYAVIGTTHSFGIGMSNIYFIKTDTVSPSNANISIQVGTEERNKISLQNATAFPNPFSQKTIIQINYPISLVSDQSLQFSLYNQLGENVTDKASLDFRQNNNSTNVYLSNQSLADGIYYYQLVVKDKKLAQGKFTIIK